MAIMENYKKVYSKSKSCYLMFMAIAHVDRLVEGNMINKTFLFSSTNKDTKNEPKI